VLRQQLWVGNDFLHMLRHRLLYELLFLTHIYFMIWPCFNWRKQTQIISSVLITLKSFRLLLHNYSASILLFVTLRLTHSNITVKIKKNRRSHHGGSRSTVCVANPPYSSVSFSLPPFPPFIILFLYYPVIFEYSNLPPLSGRLPEKCFEFFIAVSDL